MNWRSVCILASLAAIAYAVAASGSVAKTPTKTMPSAVQPPKPAVVKTSIKTAIAKIQTNLNTLRLGKGTLPGLSSGSNSGYTVKDVSANMLKTINKNLTAMYTTYQQLAPLAVYQDPVTGQLVAVKYTRLFELFEGVGVKGWMPPTGIAGCSAATPDVKCLKTTAARMSQEVQTLYSLSLPLTGLYHQTNAGSSMDADVTFLRTTIRALEVQVSAIRVAANAATG